MELRHPANCMVRVESERILGHARCACPKLRFDRSSSLVSIPSIRFSRVVVGRRVGLLSSIYRVVPVAVSCAPTIAGLLSCYVFLFDESNAEWIKSTVRW